MAAAPLVEATPETEFASYLAVVVNSVGSGTFRTFYVRREGALYDALRDGELSCAFFVSSVLTIFKKIGSFHTTVASTVADLSRSGWTPVPVVDAQPGDVLVWPVELIDGEPHAHIGFAVGAEQAVSTSSQTGTPVLHHDHPNHSWASLAVAYRLPTWSLGA